MQQLLTILHILIALALIGLVLIQRGKGADMGAGFGAGASQTMFGSQGATPFLVKFTGMLAFLFFLTSSLLSFYINKKAPDSALQMLETGQPIKVEQAIPVTPQPNKPSSQTATTVPQPSQPQTVGQ